LASADYTAVLTEAGIIRYVSSVHEHILGYPADSLPGKNPMDFIHPDDRDRVWNMRNLSEENEQHGDPIRMRFRTAFGYYHLLETRSMHCADLPQHRGKLVASQDFGRCE
jgi:PAS domain S-box-containing protein